MSDQRNRHGVLWGFSLALLAVVGAAAANGDLRVVDAAKNQDLQQVRALLGGHPDVNVRSEDGSTALLWVAHWNDLYWPLIVISDTHLATPPLGMMFFADAETGSNYGALTAAATVLTAPLVIAFLVARRRFIEGITMTGIK